MIEKKNMSMDTSNSGVKQDAAVNTAHVDVETVMKGAELVKDKYELLYADIIEDKKEL